MVGPPTRAIRFWTSRRDRFALIPASCKSLHSALTITARRHWPRHFNDIRLRKSRDDLVEVPHETIHAYTRHEAPSTSIFSLPLSFLFEPYLVVPVDFIPVFAGFRLFTRIVSLALNFRM